MGTTAPPPKKAAAAARKRILIGAKEEVILWVIVNETMEGCFEMSNKKKDLEGDV